MLLWSRRSRAAVLIGFAMVVLVVFVAPLATVVVAGLAGSWTESLPSDLGFGHFERRVVRREPCEPVGQPADRVHRGRDRAGARHVGGACGAGGAAVAEPCHRRGFPPADRGAVRRDRPRPVDRVQLASRCCWAARGGSSSWPMLCWCWRSRSARFRRRWTASTPHTGRRLNPLAPDLFGCCSGSRCRCCCRRSAPRRGWRWPCRWANWAPR